MRFVLCIFIIVFLSGCGVETDSSVRTPSEDTNGTDDDNQTTDPDDGNVTDPIEDPDDDLGEPNEDQANSDFDTRSAIKDQNACLLTPAGVFRRAMEDSSFDPTGTIDEVNGMTIASSYRYNADIAKTVVVVYYPELSAQKVGTQVNLREDNYRISYDVAWGGNDVKNIYVRTPRDLESRYYGCVRYTLAGSVAGVVKQRVYRVNE